MNRQHLQAFLWLRWRLRINQLRRGGIANAVILALLLGGAVVLARGLFVASFFVGLFALSDVAPIVLLYVWDGLVVAFLFGWATGLLTELQRAEVLSLEKLLYLPVSPSGAFLINYLSSLLGVNTILFVPAMVGLSLGLICGKGSAMFLLLPLLAAFLLMVTAVTYQFQGWLASLMVNKRRRRTIVVAVMVTFILICQLPNIIRPWGSTLREHNDLSARSLEQQAELARSLSAKKITAIEYARQAEELQRTQQEQLKELNRQTWQRVEATARLINLCLPPGWLPFGAMSAAQGNVLPALLGSLGLSLIGTVSLWRSYRTTLRLYTGGFSSGKRQPVTPAPPVKFEKPRTILLEKELPWVSEQAAAIALCGFRSLTRAPEAKMLLLVPIILVVVFGAMFLRREISLPAGVRPLVAFGAMATILLTMIQLVGNQFGFDRSGFRVFVLCSARRQDIMLGKNLAVAPLALGLGMAVLLLLQTVSPMRLDYFFATLPQLVSMYLLFCLLANLLSILAPMPIASGSLKPINAKLVPVLLQMALTFAFPLVVAPTLLPLGVGFVFDQLEWLKQVPICLILSVVECVGIVYLYRLVLTWEGELLQAREQKILEIVTTKAE